MLLLALDYVTGSCLFIYLVRMCNNFIKYTDGLLRTIREYTIKRENGIHKVRNEKQTRMMTILHELKKWQDLCLIGLIYSTPPPCLGLKKKLGADFFFFFVYPRGRSGNIYFQLDDLISIAPVVYK